MRSTALLVLALIASLVTAQNQTCSDEPGPSTEPPICKGGSGTFLPAFNAHGEADWPGGVKIVLYFLGLVWAFGGVGILTDVFMEAIEVITSREKVLEIEGRQVHVFIWNPTIANLSLMALGSSAPEIILSVIEIVSGEFFAGALGPSTIVGSAAFNLFFIIAICLLAIPEDETRRIESLGVFLVTAIFSLFAYLWLIIILVASSPDVIELWEGIVTLCFFPVLLILSYKADQGWFKCAAPVEDGTEKPDVEMQVIGVEGEDGVGTVHMTPYTTGVALKGIKAGELSEDEAANLAMVRRIKSGHVSRAQFRMEQTRRLRGKPPRLPDFQRAMACEHKLHMVHDRFYEKKKNISKLRDTIGFTTLEFHAMEDVGKVPVSITRTGDLSQEVSIRVHTEDGTAEATKDYEPIDQRVVFPAGQDTVTLEVTIIDDDEEEQDEVFYLKLSEPQPSTADVLTGRDQVSIIIIDDDHPGEIGFHVAEAQVMENDGAVSIKVMRMNGTKGEAKVDYCTEDGSAVAGKDYTETSGELVFAAGEAVKFITVPIIDDDVFEPDEYFTVRLRNPTTASLGKLVACKVTIKNDDEVTSFIERVTAKTNANMDLMSVGTEDWAQQFKDAITWPDKELGASAGVVHVITLPWKLFGAFIPPTKMGHGWVAFVVALIFIGFTTALIGDLASLFGCALGLEDSVTAITFVALGTSLPDTFASRQAALASKTADAAVTNVTGSNSVNVFLGLGLSWLIAAIYWESNGPTEDWIIQVPTCLQQKYDGAFFYVPAGDLAFSVTIFSLFCVVCLGGLLVRRFLYGAELGGPYTKQYAYVFMGLWFMYVLLSTLQTYGVIPGF
eukprot:TRINITY_DN9773_c0_g2_i1.p1 TRINITY_DN9773_c0_g2~~TRINITY_DN9773_c0_g2_i1.p1  ORF type:complete len:841 (+),score=251.91 TRINITY_DN9773_c0_g2_i1:109-2631(+)